MNFYNSTRVFFLFCIEFVNSVLENVFKLFLNLLLFIFSLTLSDNCKQVITNVIITEIWEFVDCKLHKSHDYSFGELELLKRMLIFWTKSQTHQTSTASLTTHPIYIRQFAKLLNFYTIWNDKNRTMSTHPKMKIYLYIKPSPFRKAHHNQMKLVLMD